ncbi:hypothetical protein KEM55_000851, partial [Ascosphaera atra]
MTHSAASGGGGGGHGDGGHGAGHDLAWTCLLRLLLGEPAGPDDDLGGHTDSEVGVLLPPDVCVSSGPVEYLQLHGAGVHVPPREQTNRQHALDDLSVPDSGQLYAGLEPAIAEGLLDEDQKRPLDVVENNELHIRNLRGVSAGDGE